MTLKASELLPGWATSNEQSLVREAADYLGMTPAERLYLLDLLCRDADLLLQGRADREQVLAYRDPLSADTKALLARLRTQHQTARLGGV